MNQQQSNNDIINKIDGALGFVERLIGVGAAYFNNTANAVKYINRAKSEPREYLAHELFNADWAPMPFAKVASSLETIGLSFVGDASLANRFCNVLLPEKTRLFLNSIKNPLLYESIHDYCINERFRKDVWVKGGLKLTELGKLQALAQMRFSLLFVPPASPLMIISSIGNIPVDEKVARPFINALAQNNFSPKAISDIISHPELRSLSPSQACDLLLLLCGRYVSPAHDEDTIAALQPQTDRINDFLIDQLEKREVSTFLVSPVVGGGVNVPKIHRLFLLAMKRDHVTTDKMIDFVWAALFSRAECMNHPDGTPIVGEVENRAAIKQHVEAFFEKHLPLLKALKITS